MEQVETLVRNRRYVACRPWIVSHLSEADAPMWLAAVDALQFASTEPLRALGFEEGSALTVQTIRQAYKCVR